MSIINFAPLLGQRLSRKLIVPLMARSMLRGLRPFEPRTLENIGRALRLNPNQALAIYRRGAVNFMAVALDIFFMSRGSERALQKKLDAIKVLGIERVEPVFASDRPVLIITMHMGHFPFGFLKLVGAIKKKRKVFVFKANPRNPNEDTLFAAFRRQSLEIEPLRAGEEGGKRAFLELRKGNVVAMMVDAEVHVTSRATVTFFGQPCPMQSGPATLAVLTRAVIVPIINFVDASGLSVVQVEPPLYPDKISPEESSQQIIARLTQEIARLMESWIRIDPSQVQAWTGIAETMHRSESIVQAGDSRP